MWILIYKEVVHTEDLVVGGRIMLKCFSEKLHAMVSIRTL
jgi:hypothetical protein